MPASGPNKVYEPDYAVPPGETLGEIIEGLGMDQRELSLRLGMAPKTINQIIHGKAPITHETAIGLERVTGAPASFWLNRESIYRERLARIEETKRLEEAVDWLKELPTAELRSRGYVTVKSRSPELLGEVLSFFGVSSREAWEEYWRQFRGKCSIAARQSTRHSTKDGALAAWIRLGELEAQNVQCKPFSQDFFRKAVKEIRAFTTLSPDAFVPRMREICANSGVAFVLVPEMPGVPWHGACWWTSPTKAVIMLNLRGRSEDQFWFSFFHEAGHIVKQHSKKTVFIQDGAADDLLEKEANRFAESFLIPDERMAKIPVLKTKGDLIRFAESIAISPGIVAGQYQRLTGHYNYRWLHAMIRKFKWAER